MNYAVISTIFTLGVIFVNGLTDAPNAITGCVCSGALKMKNAVILATLCNFFGTVISVRLFPAVAKNIFEAAGTDSKGMCAALLSVIILAMSAWLFGIPTSESHAIIAAIAGAAAAHGGMPDTRLIAITAIGLTVSVIGGFISGYVIYKNILKIKISKRVSRRLQIFSAGLMAFMHGAQDGQKFISIFLLCMGSECFKVPLHTTLICSLTMAAGTASGGRRIIDKVGREMVSTDDRLAISSDIAGGISLFLSTVMGLPVSTTHAKTASVMGCGYAVSDINKKTMRQMIAAWLITFPVCFGLGFIFTKLF